MTFEVSSFATFLSTKSVAELQEIITELGVNTPRSVFTAIADAKRRENKVRGRKRVARKVTTTEHLLFRNDNVLGQALLRQLGIETTVPTFVDWAKAQLEGNLVGRNSPLGVARWNLPMAGRTVLAKIAQQKCWAVEVQGARHDTLDEVWGAAVTIQRYVHAMDRVFSAAQNSVWDRDLTITSELVSTGIVGDKAQYEAIPAWDYLTILRGNQELRRRLAAKYEETRIVRTPLNGLITPATAEAWDFTERSRFEVVHPLNAIWESFTRFLSEEQAALLELAPSDVPMYQWVALNERLLKTACSYLARTEGYLEYKVERAESALKDQYMGAYNPVTLEAAEVCGEELNALHDAVYAYRDLALANIGNLPTLIHGRDPAALTRGNAEEGFVSYNWDSALRILRREILEKRAAGYANLVAIEKERRMKALNEMK